MTQNCFLSLPRMGAAFDWALIFWGLLRKTQLFPLFLKNLRGMRRKTRGVQLLQTKAKLGGRSGEPSDRRQLGWGGGRTCSLFPCACGPAAFLHRFFHHLLHLSCNAAGRSAWSCGGRDPAALGVEGWAGGTSGLAGSGFCGSARKLQQCQGSGKLPDWM